MKTKRKTALLILVPILVLGIVTLAFAGPNFARALQNKQVAKKLDLSPKQEETLKNINYEMQKKRIDLEAKIKLARLELEQELDKEDVDEDAALKLVEKTGNYRTEVRKAEVSRMIGIKKILTPEQREKMRDFMAKKAIKRAKEARKPRALQQRKKLRGRPERRPRGEPGQRELRRPFRERGPVGPPPIPDEKGKEHSS